MAKVAKIESGFILQKLRVINAVITAQCGTLLQNAIKLKNFREIKSLVNTLI